MWWSFAAFVGLRLLVIVVADTPTITPDELGAWAIAKVLVGAEPMTMQGTPRYSLLSGAVLAPVEALGLGGVAAYRLALTLLSVILVAAAALVRRTVELLRPGRSIVAASAWALTLLFPATLATTSFTWAEPVVTLWWALLLWGVTASFVARSRRATLVTSVVAGAAVVAHGRLALVPVVWVVALLAGMVQGRRAPAGGRTARGTSTIALALATTVATAAVASVADRWVADRVWGDGVVDLELGLEPTSAQWWLGLTTAAVGRLWYLLAASIGLAVLGVVALWHASTRPEQPGHRRAALTLASLLGSNLAIATAQGAGLLADLDWFGPFGGLRWDHLVYGRYLDGVLLVLCVLGLVAACDMVGRRTATLGLGASAAAMVLAATIVGVRSAGAELFPSNDVMMAGTSWMPMSTDQLALLGWTAVALVATAAAAVALRRSRRAFLVVLALWFGTGAVLGTVETAQAHRDESQPDLVGRIGAAPVAGATAVVANDVLELPEWLLGVYAQQRDLTDEGWRVGLAELDSEQLVARIASDPAETRVLVLDQDVEPNGGDWTDVTSFRGASVWRLDRAGG